MERHDEEHDRLLILSITRESEGVIDVREVGSGDYGTVYLVKSP